MGYRGVSDHRGGPRKFREEDPGKRVGDAEKRKK